ncbi:hypothetical protein UMM65_13720 [Aureibaculum sp. 2210JD6-5]|uniref:hypothetical protein n=1 Tax=Aureibaculum sp. 2210JD6-5 TaxID=3103957 RepID=UPI002AAEDC81|nr:hypothetical protein [Aureibaculum sp. 2210JD6-5]MDY7396304.1 hypothetical protein [Aureibaculum sp. 2210JD6-5]
MKTIIVLFFVSTSFLCLAQEKYRVVYDYKSENVNYYHLNKLNQVDDTLAKPRIKRNSLIEIQLQNVNPFAVDVISNIKEEEIHNSGQGFNFSSLLGGIGSFAGDNLKLNLDKLPTDSIFGKSLSSRGTNIDNKFSQLNSILTNISAVKNTFVSNLINPNFDKDNIYDNLISAANSIEDSRLATDPKDNFYIFLSELEQIVLEDSSELSGEISQIISDLEKNADDQAALSRGDIVSMNSKILNLEGIRTSLGVSKSKSNENLNKIRSLYSKLDAASFVNTYDYQLLADKVNIELKFIQSDFSKEADDDKNKSTLKTRNIKLFSKGGFKINTSVALTLNNFGSNSKDFYISESKTIGADSNDYFVPNLSTMINFYPVAGENFNIGGSFGLSIPISDEIGGINFLIGPSLFFGNKSRLSLSGGVAYGPVKRLTNGLQIGDSTAFNDVDKVTKNVYDFGYFFGISFSLFDVK